MSRSIRPAEALDSVAGVRPSGWPARVSAGLLLLLGLVLCRTLPGGALLGSTPAIVFVTLLILGAGLALFAWRLGPWVGAGLGAAAGLSAAVALAHAVDAPLANEFTFMILCGLVIAVLGFLTGSSCRSAAERSASDEDSAAFPASSGKHGTGVLDVHAALAADFCHWLRAHAIDECGDEAGTHAAVAASPAAHAAEAALVAGPEWPDFDLFVRETLRIRLGASGVRVLNVPTDGRDPHLLSCRAPVRRRTDAEPVNGEAPATSTVEPEPERGLLSGLLSGGEVFVTTRPTMDGLCPELTRILAPSGAPDQFAAAARLPGWSWLLPLRRSGRVCAVIGIARFSAGSVVAVRDATAQTALARAVRDLLETHWGYMKDQHELRALARTDRQSGLLGRVELLEQLRRVADESRRDDEPLMVMALAIEGLRRLDDNGRWSERDELVARCAAALRRRVRSDDTIGRFSDDRFVVVLRRLDDGLGRRIATRLMETVRLALPTNDADASRVQVRAGLAGGRDESDGDVLLEMALRLLDGARERGVELAVGSTPTSPRTERPVLAETVAAGDEGRA